MNLKELVGSGDKIALLTAPFLVIGVVLNVAFPALFSVGGPPSALSNMSFILLCVGVIVWAWSVLLILAKVPQGKLITDGPYALVKHPLYTGVSLLVLPWIGVLLNTWLGAVLGIVLYLASRLYAPEEERKLSLTFGPAWDTYSRRVLFPWL